VVRSLCDLLANHMIHGIIQFPSTRVSHRKPRFSSHHLEQSPRQHRSKQPATNDRTHLARNARASSRSRRTTGRGRVSSQVTDGLAAHAGAVHALVLGKELGGGIELDVCALWGC
jgi:hypothetical protein